MESITEIPLEHEERIEVERELSSLVEITLNLEYELELAIRQKD
ncbi:MAG: hypothetical protein WDZ62_00625 [Candidatus Pacearchaeota archaeon]